MANSIITYSGDGSTIQYALNFTLGFLSRNDVQCRVGSEVDGSGDPVYRTLTWITDGLVEIQGDVPESGEAIVFTRTVSKTELQHDYSNGDPIEESNLDESNKQSLMAIHEFLDGRIETLATDLNMGGFKITNLADGVADTDGANMRNLTATLALTNADVVLTNADVVSTNADVVLTNADVITTAANVALTAADVILTGLDVASATAQANLAQQWATEDEDVVVSGGEYSAYHWAQKAAASGGGSLLIANNLSDLNDAATAVSNLGIVTATTGVEGLIELATSTEMAAGSNSRVPAANQVKYFVETVASTLENKTIDGNNNTVTVLAASQLSGATPIANGGTGEITASAGFNAIKQAATTTATGVVEKATEAEMTAGTADKFPDAAEVKTFVEANGAAPIAVLSFSSASEAEFIDIFQADKNYEFDLSNLSFSTNGAELNYQLSEDSAVSYVTTHNAYSVQGLSEASAESRTGSGSASATTMVLNVGNASNHTCSGKLNIFNPIKAAFHAMATWAFAYAGSSASTFYHNVGGARLGELGTAYTPDTIRIYPSTGTFSGEIAVYEVDAV